MGPYYPVFLDLRGRKVVVIGGGRVAARKVRGLVEAGARVTVIAPEVTVDAAVERVVRRKYRRGDLRGAALAFAAADDRAVNRAVGEEARRRGIPVNVADRADECTFLVPARVRRGAVQIAISTGGTRPRLARELRERIEEALG